MESLPYKLEKIDSNWSQDMRIVRASIYMRIINSLWGFQHKREK